MRGINVGGKNILPMKVLRELIEGIGGEQVATYIQSGNAVFQHAEPDSSGLARTIRASVSDACGFEPAVLLLSVRQFERVISQNPFVKETADPKSVHVWFLSEKAGAPDLDGIDHVKGNTEQFALKDDAFYLHAPDGIARSKLAAKVERLLGVNATARNWRTVSKLKEIAQAAT